MKGNRTNHAKKYQTLEELREHRRVTEQLRRERLKAEKKADKIKEQAISSGKLHPDDLSSFLDSVIRKG